MHAAVEQDRSLRVRDHVDEVWVVDLGADLLVERVERGHVRHIPAAVQRVEPHRRAHGVRAGAELTTSASAPEIASPIRSRCSRVQISGGETAIELPSGRTITPRERTANPNFATKPGAAASSAG